MAGEVFLYFVRIASHHYPSVEQGAASLFALLPDVSEVEIVGDHSGTYRYLLPTSVSTSQGVEELLSAAGIASDVQAMPPLDRERPSGDGDHRNT